MTTAIILIVMLGGGAVWLYRLGRKSSNADRLESTHEVLGNINEFNRKEDESEAKWSGDGSRMDRIISPWLRQRRK
jgi:hypothetical protein